MPPCFPFRAACESICNAARSRQRLAVELPGEKEAHIYIYIYIYVFIYSFIHLFIFDYLHTYIHTCIHTYVHTYIHTSLHFTSTLVGADEGPRREEREREREEKKARGGPRQAANASSPVRRRTQEYTLQKQTKCAGKRSEAGLQVELQELALGVLEGVLRQAGYLAEQHAAFLKEYCIKRGISRFVLASPPRASS